MILLGPTSQAIGGQTRSMGCSACEPLTPCGGFYHGGWDCNVNCCGNPDKCMVTCVNSKNFLKFLQDAGGFEINDQRWELNQKRTKLPTYIPQIANGSGRLENLRAHTVSLTTFDVVKIGQNQRPSTPEALR